MPKFLYEAVPWFCLGFGTSAYLIMDIWFAKVFALVLYAMGAWIWILRSNYRRSDRKSRRIEGSRVGFAFYEALPFIYVGVSVFIWGLSENFWFLPSSVLFLLAASQIFILRKMNRNRAKHRP